MDSWSYDFYVRDFLNYQRKPDLSHNPLAGLSYWHFGPPSYTLCSSVKLLFFKCIVQTYTLYAKHFMYHITCNSHSTPWGRYYSHWLSGPKSQVRDRGKILMQSQSKVWPSRESQGCARDCCWPYLLLCHDNLSSLVENKNIILGAGFSQGVIGYTWQYTESLFFHPQIFLQGSMDVVLLRHSLVVSLQRRMWVSLLQLCGFRFVWHSNLRIFEFGALTNSG